MPKGRLMTTLTRPTRRLRASASASSGVSEIASACGGEAGEAVLEIGNEIAQILEPGVKAEHRALASTASPCASARDGPAG